MVSISTGNSVAPKPALKRHASSLSPKSGLRAIAVAVAAVAVLALAACGGPGVQVTPTVAPTATAGPFASDRVSCTFEDQTEAFMSLGNSERYARQTKYVEVLDRYREALHAIPGVISTGVGFNRDQNFEKTGAVGIFVTVDKGLPDEEIDPHDQIPSSIEGCLVNLRRGSQEVPLENEVKIVPESEAE